jgi:hypothetical protein
VRAVGMVGISTRDKLDMLSQGSRDLMELTVVVVVAFTVRNAGLLIALSIAALTAMVGN